MTDLVMALATEARRAGLVTALCRYPRLTLESLAHLLHEGVYADELASLTLADLRRAALLEPPTPSADESVEDAVIRMFRGRPGIWTASSFFVRTLSLRRWTAQQTLGDLAERGLIERRGVTSATRYRLVRSHQLDSCVVPNREGCS